MRTPILLQAARLLTAAMLSTLALAAPAGAQAPADWSNVPVTHVEIPIPAGAPPYGSNIIDIDQAAHRLYAGDRALGGIDIFDISGPIARYITTVPTSAGANGVSVGASVHRVYAGLDDSEVAIIDTDPSSKTYNSLLASPNTGGTARADEMDFDPVEMKLYVANASDGFVSVIDGHTDQIIKQIGNLGPALEQPRYNPADGMMYLVGNGLDVIYKFDPRADVLVDTYDIVDPCAPNGLAINPNTNQALLGCSGGAAYPHAAVWDFASERVVQVLQDAGRGNTSIYDPTVDHFFFSARNNDDPNQPATAIYSGGAPVRFLGEVPAGKFGGASVAFDETNRIVYVHDIRPGLVGLSSFPLPG